MRLKACLVLSWLERDQGKHQLGKEHKPALMEHFAAELWCSGQRSWKIDDIEKWYTSYLVQNQQIRDELLLAPKSIELPPAQKPWTFLGNY